MDHTRSFINKFGALLKRKIVFIPLIIVALIVAYSFTREPKVSYEKVSVERGTLIQEVSVTGSVVPVDSVELSFERVGRIVDTPVSVGERVSTGQVLLRLDATTDVLALRQAEAALAADEAALSQLRVGTRAEDLNVLISKRDAAAVDLSDALSSLADKIQDAYTRADDAVRNYADRFFDSALTPNPQINIPINDAQLKIDLSTRRVASERTLGELYVLTAKDPVTSVASVRQGLYSIASFLDLVSTAVNSLTPSSALSQSTIDTYRSQISTARASVNTALSGVTTGEDAYNTAKFALELAEKNLAVARAGTAPEEIQAAEAAVLGDKAKIDSVRHDIALASLRAPFAGVVAKQDGKIGQVVSVNTPLLTLIGEGGFQIEANVPEADIAKLAVGQSARVTLDAYGSDNVFSATVTEIEPAETLIDNVATYKVTLTFVTQDTRIRSGMTANIDILSAQRPGVLMVPVRAVLDVDGAKVVRIPQSDGTLVDREVSVGLRSSDGRVEILSGLEEEETVAVGR